MAFLKFIDKEKREPINVNTTFDCIKKSIITITTIESTLEYLHVSFNVTYMDKSSVFDSPIKLNSNLIQLTNQEIIDKAWDGIEDKVINWIDFQTKINELTSEVGKVHIPSSIRM